MAVSIPIQDPDGARGMNALALRMQRREGFEEEDEMYTVRRGNANDFVWGFVLGTFVVIERQLPGYSPLCVSLMWEQAFSLDFSCCSAYVTGGGLAARRALHNCFMFHVCAGGTAVCSAHAEAWYRGRCIVQCGIHDNAAAASSERVTTQHVTFRYHLRFA